MTQRILLTAAACILLNGGASPVRGAFDVVHIPAERWGTPDAELALGFPLTPQRNGFLLISSDDPFEPIVSVSLGGRGDAFVVDHLVFGANPAVPAAPRAFGSVKALFRR
ncbi:MAG: hypothetical protein AB7V45_07390 [Candidatus Krumholzibacteriia bacterium]